jgi:antiviral helicase SKI2
MVDSLTSSLQRLRLNVGQIDPAIFDARLREEENGTTDEVRPPQRAKKDLESLKPELEDEFLTPSPRFNPDWLNRLQRCVTSLFLFYIFTLICTGLQYK